MSQPVFVQKIDRHVWRLHVWVQPRAKKSGVCGVYQDSIKIKLTSPPVDDKANKELVGFIASRLGLKPRQVRIESGHASRSKSVIVECAGLPPWQELGPEQ